MNFLDWYLLLNVVLACTSIASLSLCRFLRWKSKLISSAQLLKFNYLMLCVSFISFAIGITFVFLVFAESLHSLFILVGFPRNRTWVRLGYAFLRYVTMYLPLGFIPFVLQLCFRVIFLSSLSQANSMFIRPTNSMVQLFRTVHRTVQAITHDFIIRTPKTWNRPSRALPFT